MAPRSKQEISHSVPFALLMAPKGFEPSTPRLRVWCSNQAELRSRDKVAKMVRALKHLNQAELQDHK